MSRERECVSASILCVPCLFLKSACWSDSWDFCLVCPAASLLALTVWLTAGQGASDSPVHSLPSLVLLVRRIDPGLTAAGQAPASLVREMGHLS